MYVLVPPVRNRARRCRDRQEGLVDAGRLRRGSQVVDVALQLEEAVVRNRAHADSVVPRDVRPILAVAASLEFGIELMEALAVAASRKGIGALDLTQLEAAEPLQCIEGPARGLAELTIIRHVDPRLHLTRDHVADRVFQRRVERLLLDWLPALSRAHELEELGRPDEAAGVRRENASGAAFHGGPVVGCR